MNTLPIEAIRDAALELLDRPQPQDHQRPPEDPDWKAWCLSSGRGAGKSFASMHWLAGYAREHAGLRARIIAPTFADGVASCVEGPNGLLRFAPEARFMASAAGGSRVEFPNGSFVWIIGTPTPKDVDRLRALTNCDVDVYEEAAANPQLQAAFDQAKLSRRGKNAPNRWVATTTPRSLKIMRDWQKDPRVHYVRVASHANKYMDPEWLAELEESYQGTRLYRQEVLGEIIDDIEGALWTLANIERSMVERENVQIVRHVVGVDPPSGPGTCGIVVVGADAANHLYVLDDYSVTDATPHEWAEAVYSAHVDYDALVVAEVNQGGRMVTEVLKQEHKDLPVKTVHAATGKTARAEPIALLWEADEQVGHFAPAKQGALSKLIDQCTSWDGSFSPDRLDALVWAAHHLRGTALGEARVAKPRGQLPGW